jgi:hypothetical protein
MIALLVIALLFGGGFGGSSSLDLSDPAVLATFSENVSTIVKDPDRAPKVVAAVYRINIMTHQANSEAGLVEQDIENIHSILGDYNATREEVHASLGVLGNTLQAVNQTTIQEREVMRQNTTKKEWKKLLKELSK